MEGPSPPGERRVKPKANNSEANMRSLGLLLLSVWSLSFALFCYTNTFNLNEFLYNPFKMFFQHCVIKKQACGPSDKNTRCTLFTCYWLGSYRNRFHGSSKTTVKHKMAFLGVLMHLFHKQLPCQNVRIAALLACKALSSLGKKKKN